ncbi:MAG: HAD hydrolase family protein [Fusobacteriaceae bacterium]|jgi:hydroxymethylpyrimidine pyrophosphatase-like HAD family hydrolase|nr:HAD hydrolase family protein [Fusobacteriaceae bacterium]
MNLFASDIDNTLIYSYKRNIGSNKIVVEKKDEFNLSFMTEKSFALLCRINEIATFVPITTRSIEQYNRINFGNKDLHKFALVCNGGILLDCGKYDIEWYNETLRDIEESLSELEKGKEILRIDKNRNFEVRHVDNMLVFTKSENISDTLGILKEKLDNSLVDIYNNGEKVYITPKKLNKGRALLRLKKLFGTNGTICAGDSEMDVSMLECADISILPEKLFTDYTDMFKNKTYVIPKDRIFSDEMLEKVEIILQLACD